MAGKNNEITTKFSADISDLKAGITQANRQIKLANAEFKAASSAMDYVADSADGVQTKLTQLTKVYEAQNKVLNNYQKQLEIVEKEQGANSAGAENLRIKIANQQATVNKTASEIQNYKSKLSDLEKTQDASAREAEEQVDAYTALEDKIRSQETDLASLKKEYSAVVLEQGKSSDAANDLANEIDKLSGELSDDKKALQEAGDAADELDKSLEGAGDSAESASGGFTVLKGALANLVADGIRMAIDAVQDFVKQTIEVGKNFDSAMSEVAAISGATGEDLQMLRDTAKEFGATTVFSASESADALKYMSLAGWSAQESADALGGVLNLAASSGMDLAQASDMVTDYLSAFGLEAKDSAKFADMLAFAQANSNTTAEALGEAFKNSAANMNAAGQDVQTVTSLLAMMANQGLKGSEAGTALTAVMRDMTSKMKDGKIAIGETSVSVMDANGNYRDMTDILTDVEKATQGMGDAERATALQSTFTSDSIKGLNLILNAGVGEAAAFEEELRSSSGTAEEMAGVMQDNLGGDLKALNSQLEGVQITLYEKLEPALRAGVEVLSNLLDAVNFVVEHSTEFITAITAMGAGIAAYLAYTTAMTVMTKGWQALTIVTKAQAAAQAALNAVMALNPIGLIIAAIVALVAAFVILWNKSEAFREFWITLWEEITAAAGAAWEAIKNAGEVAWEAIKEYFTIAWEYIQDIWSGAQQFFTGVWQGIQLIFSGVIGYFQAIFTSAWNAVKLVWNTVTGYFKLVWEGIKTIFSVVKSVLSGNFGDAWNAIKKYWDKVKGYFSGIWEGIKSIFEPVTSWFSEIFQGAVDAVENIFGGLIEIIKAPINFLIKGMNKFIKSLNKIEIPDWVPAVGGKGINLPTIPELAQGGVLSKGQVGLLEGTGAEAVVPLENNRKWIAATASALRQAMIQEGILAAGGTSAQVINNYNYTQNNTSPKALSRLDIYRQTQNQLNFAKGGA